MFKVSVSISRSDTSKVVFSVEFIKIDKNKPNEVVEEDKPAELVKEFHHLAHNISLNSKRRISVKERAEALKWMETYGFEKALWMVRQCVKVQKEMDRPEILSFVGLSLYETAAAGDYENHQLLRHGHRAAKASHPLFG